MDCITPSQSTPIPHGESLDIYQLLAHPDVKFISADEKPQLTKHCLYKPRRPVLGGSKPNLDFLDAQIARAERKSISKKSRSVKSIVPQKGPEEIEFPTPGVLESISTPSPQIQTPTGTTSSVAQRSKIKLHSTHVR
jgi:hypothetical protein